MFCVFARRSDHLELGRQAQPCAASACAASAGPLVAYTCIDIAVACHLACSPAAAVIDRLGEFQEVLEDSM